mgnify:CR=1 FL=1
MIVLLQRMPSMDSLSYPVDIVRNAKQDPMLVGNLGEVEYSKSVLQLSSINGDKLVIAGYFSLPETKEERKGIIDSEFEHPFSQTMNSLECLYRLNSIRNYRFIEFAGSIGAEKKDLRNAERCSVERNCRYCWDNEFQSLLFDTVEKKKYWKKTLLTVAMEQRVYLRSNEGYTIFILYDDALKQRAGIEGLCAEMDQFSFLSYPA